MAYADKLTNMRRLVLIKPYPETNGDIIWEGVEIDGSYLLRNVNNGALLYLDDNGFTPRQRLEQLCEDYDMDLSLQIVYQDKKGEDWEPRKEVK